MKKSDQEQMNHLPLAALTHSRCQRSGSAQVLAASFGLWRSAEHSRQYSPSILKHFVCKRLDWVQTPVITQAQPLGQNHFLSTHLRTGPPELS